MKIIENISYPIITSTIVVLTIVIISLYSILPTIEKTKNYILIRNDLKNININKNATGEFFNHSQKVDSLYNKYSKNRFDKNIQLAQITNICKELNVVITNVKTENIEIKNIPIISESFTISGSFNKCLMVIHNLELTLTNGYISNVKFETIENQTDKILLVTTITTQLIDHEE